MTQDDLRNHLTLVDARRKEFLANLPEGLANDYSLLYRRYGRLAIFDPRYEGLIGWLDKNLILSGSTGGKRAEQLVDTIKSEHASPQSEALYLRPYVPNPEPTTPTTNGASQQKRSIVQLR